MIYQVEISETLQRIVSIDADDETSAIITAKQLYRNESIVLSSSDYVDTTFETFPPHRQ